MAVLSSDFTDHTVLIYDLTGNHLISTVVRNHDRDAQHIQVNLIPEELKVNDNCKILMLSSPTPCEFMGKVKKVGGNLFIAMFQGQEKENRGATRYPVNSPALIDTLLIDGDTHNLQTPLKVTLLNISTSGVRFRAPYYSFEKGDLFRMHFIISNNRKEITAEVINYVDDPLNNSKAFSDYGCKFVVTG